jgi:hypothetical protein
MVPMTATAFSSSQSATRGDIPLLATISVSRGA